MMEFLDTGAIEYIDTGVAPNPLIPVKPSYFPPIEGCRFYDGDRLVHDFKPCKNPDGIDGMYDFVEETFWPSDAFFCMVEKFYRSADEISVRYGGDGDG